jgi:hypothetical protein
VAWSSSCIVPGTANHVLLYGIPVDDPFGGKAAIQYLDSHVVHQVYKMPVKASHVFQQLTAVQCLEQLKGVFAAAPAQHVEQVYLPGTASHVVQEG